MNILESKQLGGSKAQVLWIALPLAAAMLTGCPLYTDNGHPIACGPTTTCPAGTTCVSGMCQPNQAPTCTQDSQCSSNEHCENMACVPGQRVCETHGDCDPGRMCDITATSGSCVPSTTCTSDATCMTGFWCDYRDTCVPRNPGQCRSQADCTGTDRCIEGTCHTLPTTCQFAYDCPAGTACVNAECTAVCHAETDCAAGDTCNTHTHFCEPMVDCSTSAMCPTGDHCVDGRCLADCHTGASCPTSGVETSYCDPADHFCHPGWQPAIACTHEGVQAECATGRLCLSHVCRTPCPDGMTSQAAGDAQCQSIDSEVPHCILDTASTRYLCNHSTTATASCRVSSDCTGSQQCVNAACQ